MYKMFVILVCKLICKISKIRGHEGSVIGGYWALKLDKNILKKITLPKYVIGVTGSSGKSSLTELINKILNSNDYKVLYNKEGSNTINGITSLILKNTSIFGNFKGDVLLMELDEQYMRNIFAYFSPTHLIVTNITRDQPPRNSHPEKIFNLIKIGIPQNTELILNADDPYVNRLRLGHTGKVVTYGMEKNDYSYPSTLNNIDGAYCPICKSKLVYSTYHYGHIGIYNCPNNDFNRGNVNYEAKNIDVDKQTITINDNNIHLPSNFLYSVYFTTAAFALSRELGIKSDRILEVLNSDKLKTKRLNIYDFDNRSWQMLVSKNENNLSYKQSLDYILHQKGNKTIILGFDSSSRRYKENDISWIWDIDFELLTHKSIDKIILIGKFNLDMLLRMEYAGIKKDKLILVDDLSNLSKIIKTKTKGNIYSMVCFDKEIELKRIIKEEAND